MLEYKWFINDSSVLSVKKHTKSISTLFRPSKTFILSRKNCTRRDRLNPPLNIQAIWNDLAGFFFIIVDQYLQFLHLHFLMLILHRLHKSFGFWILERIWICPWFVLLKGEVYNWNNTTGTNITFIPFSSMYRNIYMSLKAL